MLRIFCVALLLISSVTAQVKFASFARPQRPSRPDNPWQLVWSDEFNGNDGSLPDSTKWAMETGNWGWGNNELEYYTSRAVNAQQKSGNLVITALKENYGGSAYTSARLKTQGLFEHTYGRVEARIKLPFGQGIWPAFWMLGADIGTNPWPACGEIDIMENIGREPSIIHGTIHGPGYSGGSGIGSASTLPSGRFADDFHVYAVEWAPNEIKFWVDNTLYATRTPADLPAGKTWVFQHNFFILLNVAVGGYWPGNPDGTTTFPQTMLVDYVRVYDKKPS
ncbi:MAG TPA: glycoside hydrolase family 16 protein [Terriglobales bacterium]|nr:glycoside hydrolase family 16 protein [Terriglobales bacterium]